MDEKKLFPNATAAEVFLGSYLGHDLYWDSQEGVIPTVIARFGAGKDEYKSGLILADTDPYLGEAKRRAGKRGLDVVMPKPGDKREYKGESVKILEGIKADMRVGVALGDGHKKVVSVMMAPTGADVWCTHELCTPDEVADMMQVFFKNGARAFGIEKMAGVITRIVASDD